MIAMGAAALLLGAHVAETTIEATKKDNAAAVEQRRSVGSLLWRDFLTLRQNHHEELIRRVPQQIVISRG
jgi:hypothetical protein